MTEWQPFRNECQIKHPSIRLGFSKRNRPHVFPAFARTLTLQFNLPRIADEAVALPGHNRGRLKGSSKLGLGGKTLPSGQGGEGRCHHGRGHHLTRRHANHGPAGGGGGPHRAGRSDLNGGALHREGSHF
eukprot:906210-Pyramimonas_sp.AAC.1